MFKTRQDLQDLQDVFKTGQDLQDMFKTGQDLQDLQDVVDCGRGAACPVNPVHPVYKKRTTLLVRQGKPKGWYVRFLFVLSVENAPLKSGTSGLLVL